MKHRLLTLIAAATLFLSPFSMALVLDIDFNTGGPTTEFNLGTFASNESGVDFYSYGTVWTASANPVYPGTTTPIPLVPDAVQIFAHENTGTGDVSFGVILETPNGSGGGSFSALVDWSAPALLAFVDDPGESGSVGSGGPQNISLNWSTCCTDGFVISGFNPDDLFLSLSNVSFSDLNQVIFLSPTMQNVAFDVTQGDPININITPCDPSTDPDGCVIVDPSPVPEPGTLLLFFAGLTGLLLRQRNNIS